MLKCKNDVINKLKQHGYSTYNLRNRKIIRQEQLSKISKGEMISLSTLDTICNLLHCQPGDIIEHIPDAEQLQVAPSTEQTPIIQQMPATQRHYK